MPRLEPSLIPVVTDLERAMRELGIPYGIVGALVPELLLAARPRRMTNDADVAVAIESLAAFDALKARLTDYGFVRTPVPHRMRHESGGLMDILPFGEAIAPDGRLRLEEGAVLNMAGFRYVVHHAVQTQVDGGPILPLAPLPLYALLKLVAFSDRKADKDLGGVLHCLEHYAEDDDDRRYVVEYEGAGVPYDDTCAYLLGLDGRRFLDDAVGSAVAAVLDRFVDPDADVVGIAAREQGRHYPDDGQRAAIFELFTWYRRGTGL